MPQHAVPDPQLPAVPDGTVEQVNVVVRYANGAAREYLAYQPLNFVLAVAPTGSPTRLGPGLEAAERKEPRLGVFFDGNPAAGGIQVHSEGVAP